MAEGERGRSSRQLLLHAPRRARCADGVAAATLNRSDSWMAPHHTQLYKSFYGHMASEA